MICIIQNNKVYLSRDNERERERDRDRLLLPGDRLPSEREPGDRDPIERLRRLRLLEPEEELREAEERERYLRGLERLLDVLLRGDFLSRLSSSPPEDSRERLRAGGDLGRLRGSGSLDLLFDG